MASIYNYIHIFIYIHTQMKFYRRFNHWLRCAGAPQPCCAVSRRSAMRCNCGRLLWEIGRGHFWCLTHKNEEISPDFIRFCLSSWFAISHVIDIFDLVLPHEIPFNANKIYCWCMLHCQRYCNSIHVHFRSLFLQIKPE